MFEKLELIKNMDFVTYTLMYFVIFTHIDTQNYNIHQKYYNFESSKIFNI
jgi:hypothetical protein